MAGAEASVVAEAINASGLEAIKAPDAWQEIQAALQRFAEIVNELDALLRSLCREAAIQHLKLVGIGSPASVVDAAIGACAPDPPAECLSMFNEPEPWPEPVDGATLCYELHELFCRHVVLVRHASEALALWVLHAYSLDAFFFSPLLALLSPEMRCGKTTTLDLLGALVPRPLSVSNITAAVLFRVVEKFQPTLLIDEADSFLADRDELRGILNSGHKRSSARAARLTGEKHELELFSTWAPKAIASIRELPSTLQDRAIIIRMKRKAPHESVEGIHWHRIEAETEHLRRRAVRWANDNLPRITGADPEVPSELQDRARDNWRPLLAIADLLGGEWAKRARAAAVALSGRTGEGTDTTATELLLHDMRDVFVGHQAQRLRTEEILRMLHSREDRPWAEWRNGQPLSAAQLAKLLGRFEIRPKQFRSELGGRKERGYARADFADAFTRYLPSEAVQPVQASGFNEIAHDPPRYEPSRTGIEPSANTQEEKVPPAVPGVPAVPAHRSTGLEGCCSGSEKEEPEDLEVFEL